ncbi:hypothetical protein LSH36_87g06000 [Paralvinella palmiformis]|uniref:Uncharacterized protein n=1 Tax=Paralvinella palmiformis TaxID=53620 RepID=A0AAD9K1I8_9ANNE|nr:hypothetical protein LSH36_87g06000 [Paralvinella palmiformis]
MATDTRQDLHQTSTGVGHHWRPGYYFPSSNFKSVKLDPIPPTLNQPNQVQKEEPYKTTTGTVHDLKHLGGPYGNNDPLYKKAPGHWKIDYVKDLHEKLQHGGWRKPLTMGNQCSETHEQFRNQVPFVQEAKEFVPNPQGFVLDNHHTEGPSKKVVPTTENPKLKGKPYYVRDKGVLDLVDPYLTTTNMYHRSFKPKELQGYPKKDIATYWECEEYPKAWGHGLQHNPLPKDSVPRQKPPMRDEMVFKSETKIRRVPQKLVPVPHSGLKTEYSEYEKPSDVKMKEIYYCPVDTPYNLPAPGNKSTFAAPNMYNTEYQNIGSRRPITC